MTRIKHNLGLWTLVSLLTFSGCFQSLDQTPFNELTSNQVYEDFDN
ncbi:MAG: hypothetical protein AAF804_18810 [Bacteroidota bacterium]